VLESSVKDIDSRTLSKFANGNPVGQLFVCSILSVMLDLSRIYSVYPNYHTQAVT
jgi:hypothetical protein